MRKPFMLFILSIFFWISYINASQCPHQLPTTCKCDNLVDGFRVTCLSGANLNDIMTALKDDIIDKLDVRNCDPIVKHLVTLPSMKVRSLSISNCGIEKIEEDAFSSISSELEELNLGGNKLTNVPLLGNLPKLEMLNLSSNLLTDIAENAFDGAPKLRHLRIENNRICTLSKNALNETKSTLELLDLSGNCFSSIPAQNLRNSPRLMYLDFSSNRITELAKFSFMNLPMLKELRLSTNRLGALSPLAFMNVPQLSHLFVRDNLITNVDVGTLQMFKELEAIDLSKNAIIQIPSFKEMENLKHVVLDHNKIRRIDTLTFSANPRLTIVSLQNNDISLIARNSFDSLDQLVILLLGNNSLTTIEKGVFDGIKNLQQLHLRNNLITEITNVSFVSLPNLNLLDLANNEITLIRPGSFKNQKHLFYLDLSRNNLTTFEKGVFENPISNIILDGNKFYCDDKFDWFVTYLVKNQVKTFLPNQPEITCSGPEKYAGVRLKDLMIKKANETLTQGLNTLGFNTNGQNNNVQQQSTLLSQLLPMLSQSAGNSGLLQTITQAIPSLRNVPGLSGFSGRSGHTGNPNLDSAIEQVAEPLVRFATGAQPAASDIQQLMKAIPNMVVNIPGFGNVDLSKVPPPVLEHVLRGGEIPGIPRETLDAVIKTYTSRMYSAAERARQGQSLEGDEKYLPDLTTLPQGVVDGVMNGNNLPYLTADQTNVIKQYYTQKIPVQMGGGQNASESLQFNPQVFSMLTLLPPNYNISKIPPEVLKSVMKGEMPDLSLLPQDVIDYIRDNSEKIFKSFKVSADASIDDILSKLPRFEPPEFEETFVPYDINQVDNDLVVKEDEKIIDDGNMKIYTAAALGLFATLSIAIVSLYVWYMKRGAQPKDTSIS